MSFFKTTEEFAKYVPVDVNMHFENLSAAIAEADHLYIKALLGDLHDVLLTDYTSNNNVEAGINTMTADNQALLPHVQRALAYYAAYQMVEHVGVMVGSAGIQQVNGRDSQPAPRWKVRDLQLKYINNADRFADELLSYLEDNASGTKYQEWFTDADANTRLSGYIVYSTGIASKYIDINNSRRLFLRLKKRIKHIEENQIKRLICTDQHAALIAQIAANNLTAANEALIEIIEPIIAKKALYLSLPSIRVNVSNEGLHLLSSTDSITRQDQASHDDIKWLMKDLRENEFGFLADEDRLTKFLQDNINDYPLIRDSECYTANAVPRKWVADNDCNNKHFSI